MAKGCFHAVLYAVRCLVAAGVCSLLIEASVLLPESLPGMTSANGATALTLGFVAGTFLFVWLAPLPGVYVFGHELTHWLAAGVFRRRTRGFRAGSQGGAVMVERPNIWITLAPYFVPIYTLFWIGLYGFYCLVRGSPPRYADLLVYGGTGMTYAFHVVWTFRALRMGQSDLKRYGVLFSLLVIFACNLAFIYAGVVIATGGYRAGASCLVYATLQAGHTLDRVVKGVVQLARSGTGI